MANDDCVTGKTIELNYPRYLVNGPGYTGLPLDVYFLIDEEQTVTDRSPSAKCFAHFLVFI